jgi:hypothetical protein
MSDMIVNGNFGAYLVDNRMKYYLVKWTSQPWKIIHGTLETTCGVAQTGEWVCKGNWLNNIDHAPQWYSLSDVEVVVRCQFVLGSDVVLSPHGTDNEFPKMNQKYGEEGNKKCWKCW